MRAADVCAAQARQREVGTACAARKGSLAVRHRRVMAIWSLLVWVWHMPALPQFACTVAEVHCGPCLHIAVWVMMMACWHAGVPGRSVCACVESKLAPTGARACCGAGRPGRGHSRHRPQAARVRVQDQHHRHVRTLARRLAALCSLAQCAQCGALPCPSMVDQLGSSTVGGSRVLTALLRGQVPPGADEPAAHEAGQCHH